MLKKEIVIGLVLENLFTDFSRELVEEVHRAFPIDQDVQLVVIPGTFDDGKNKDKNMADYLHQYNVVYRLAVNCRLDGLIVHIGSLDERKRKLLASDYLRAFRDVPKVMIGSNLEGYVSVGYDNYTGIREAVECIINVNGITDLCMIGGREDNYESILRKKIFIDCLDDHGISFADHMYIGTDMSDNTEAQAEILLNMNPRVKAIFCVNDSVAVGLYKAMAKRRLVPGKDILVFGFDNTRMSSLMKPSLASIGSVGPTIGQRAVELLFAMAARQEVQSEWIPTRLYGRGSLEYQMYDYSMKDILTINEDFIYRMFEECFYRYDNSRIDREQVNLRRLFYEITSRMMRAVKQRYLGMEEFEEIGNLIDVFFREGAIRYTDAEKLLTSINRLQDSLVYVQKINSINANVNVNRLFLRMKDQGLMAFAEQSRREHEKNRDREIRIQNFLVRTTAMSDKDNSVDKLWANMAEIFTSDAEVYIFDEPVVYEQQKIDLFPEEINLKCVVKDGELHRLPENRQRCYFSEMFYRKEMSFSPNGSVVFLIAFRNQIYGMLLCEIDEDVYTHGDFLATQIGRAIYLNREKEG